MAKLSNTSTKNATSNTSKRGKGKKAPPRAGQLKKTKKAEQENTMDNADNTKRQRLTGPAKYIASVGKTEAKLDKMLATVSKWREHDDQGKAVAALTAAIAQMAEAKQALERLHADADYSTRKQSTRSNGRSRAAANIEVGTVVTIRNSDKLLTRYGKLFGVDDAASLRFKVTGSRGTMVDVELEGTQRGFFVQRGHVAPVID